jgi:hypothetical protein
VKIAVLDFETDPFEFGAIPSAFAAGFYDGSTFTNFWGSNCAAELVAHLERQTEPLTIYAHNGGKFDVYYLLPFLKPGELRIINGRIVSAFIGIHELRDSFSIMPFGLAKYKKLDIDYHKLEKKHREENRSEIITYLEGDCRFLYELCEAFLLEFGDKLTVGSASLKQLKRFHKFGCGNENFDKKFRDDFYFGGRNQVFRAGILPGPWKVYDVYSMYPSAMRNFLHPIGTGYEVDKKIRHNTSFVVVEGENFGAFPVRSENGGLDFTRTYGTFHTTIHEWQAALDTGTFKPHKIIKTYGFLQRGTFREWVDHFFDLRDKAKREGDKMRVMFYKYVLNSCYGKFAQNPNNFFDWILCEGRSRPAEWHDCTPGCSIAITPPDTPVQLVCPKMWTPAYLHDSYVIWQRPTPMHHFYNIATGCSITGAARSLLLRGIAGAVDPVYCDTDSIICRSLSGMPIGSNLGEWGLEVECNLAAIGGKKLYALFSDRENPNDTNCVKKAHKGARLKASEVLRIAQGETVTYENPVPKFRWDGTAVFIKRRIRMTV